MRLMPVHGWRPRATVEVSGLCCGTTGAGPLATTRVRECFHGTNRDVDQATVGGEDIPAEGSA